MTNIHPLEIAAFSSNNNSRLVPVVLFMLFATCCFSIAGCRGSNTAADTNKKEESVKSGENGDNNNESASDTSSRLERKDAPESSTESGLVKSEGSLDRSTSSEYQKRGAKGNDGSASSGPKSTAGKYLEEKALLKKCIDTYQTATSYEDRGVIQLFIPDPKQPINETSPMQIAWERPNKLALRTSQVISSWTPQTFESVAGNKTYQPFEKQRVVRPRPDKIDLSWLLDDHLQIVFSQRALSTPLSIELLFADYPLRDFQEYGEFKLLDKEMFNSIECQRLEASMSGNKWVLWIDTSRNLILRYELPVDFILQTLPTELSTDKSKIRFSIDMVDAKVNQTIDWGPWELERMDDQVLVRRFIDPPPRNLPKQLGSILQPIALKDPKGDDIFDSAQRKKSITILFWIDDSEESRAFVDEVYKFEKALKNKSLNASTEVLLVTDKKAERMQVTSKAWNCTLPIAVEPDRELGLLCGVMNYQSSVLIGSDGSIQSIDATTNFDALLQKVENLVSGVDLAKRVLKLAADDEARYASRLHRNVINKEQIARLQPDQREIAAFPLSFHALECEWRSDLNTPAVAGAGETYLPFSTSNAIAADAIFSKSDNRYRVAALIDELGNVVSVDQTGVRTQVSTIPIDQATNAKRIHVLPDPWNHESIAIVPEGLPRFWLTEAPVVTTGTWKPNEAAQFGLEEGESATAAMWAFHESTSVLCLVTNKKRLLVLNPETQKVDFFTPQQLGNANSITNIVPSINERAEAEGWNMVWNDRKMEKIERLASSDATKSPVAGPLDFAPEMGNWLWGRGKSIAHLVGLEKFPSGETGAVLMDRNFKPQIRQTLSVLPEQCKLLAATNNSSNVFYWMSTAPNRVIHLQTADRENALNDQMSLGERVYGGTILPDGKNLKMLVILKNEVSCWKIQPLFQ